MGHILSYVLLRSALYPILYWLGFLDVRGLSLGKASILPFSDLGEDEDLVWYELRV